jgi:peptidyl-prolyl cis-trans isomerase SurA
MNPQRNSSALHSAVIIVLLGLTAFASSSVQAQKKSSKSKDTKSVTAPDQSGSWLIKTTFTTIGLPEFEAAYRRMNDKEPYATTLDSLKDFLNVYADYRLKLQDAHEEGVDRDPKIIQEIKGYRDMLAGPYLLDKEVTEPAIRQMYDRRQWEMHAAHFLAGIRNPNDPKDTLRAYNKAMEALRRIKDGQPMAVVVMSDGNRKLLSEDDRSPVNNREKISAHPPIDSVWSGSDDKGSAKNGGDLGYFTGTMTVRPFEDAVYALQPGEMTQYPIRTRFGYHIIQLYDKVPRTGGVRVEHILVSMPHEFITDDTVKYFQKIDSIYQVLKAGANFEQVARESSEDKISAPSGGVMEINREDRRAEPVFDRTAYGLKDGEMSGIIRSSFGYHIVKRIATLPKKSYEQERDQLKQMYKRFYFDEDKSKKLSFLRDRYNARVDSASVKYFLAHVDSTRTSLDSAWARDVDAAGRARVIYSIESSNLTVGALIDSMNAQPGTPLARSTVWELVTKYLDEEALEIAARDVSKKYPEFDQIMRDYQNGIVLFELENKRVWSKVVPDSVKELAYYKEHSAKFMWPERIDISEIFVTSDSVAKQLYKRILAGENFDTLAKKYTERPGYKEKAGHWGLMMKDENELAKKTFNFLVDEVKEPMSFQGGYSIVRMNRRDPIRQKTFDEARQEVASQYQDDTANQLRLNWVTALRKKYKRQINEALITSEWNKNHPRLGSADSH